MEVLKDTGSFAGEERRDAASISSSFWAIVSRLESFSPLRRSAGNDFSAIMNNSGRKWMR